MIFFDIRLSVHQVHLVDNRHMVYLLLRSAGLARIASRSATMSTRFVLWTIWLGTLKTISISFPSTPARGMANAATPITSAVNAYIRRVTLSQKTPGSTDERRIKNQYKLSTNKGIRTANLRNGLPFFRGFCALATAP